MLGSTRAQPAAAALQWQGHPVPPCTRAAPPTRQTVHAANCARANCGAARTGAVQAARVTGVVVDAGHGGSCTVAQNRRTRHSTRNARARAHTHTEARTPHRGIQTRTRRHTYRRAHIATKGQRQAPHQTPRSGPATHCTGGSTRCHAQVSATPTPTPTPTAHPPTHDANQWHGVAVNSTYAEGGGVQGCSSRVPPPPTRLGTEQCAHTQTGLPTPPAWHAGPWTHKRVGCKRQRGALAVHYTYSGV